MKDNAICEGMEEFDLPNDKDQDILKDETITLSYTVNGTKVHHKLRRIAWDDKNSKLLVFLINSFYQDASVIAGIYKHRCQIELLFKRLKQNFPFKYFLGDNQKAIEVHLYHYC